MAGSTSVEPFAELLAEEYMMHYPQIHIYVQGGGSTAGIEAVRTRAAQIGLSSRSLTSGEKDLYAVTIAKDAIAIIVHPKNPVQNLPLEKIIGVFSGKIRNWNELGGYHHPIILVTREEGSGTREAFQKLVMGKEEICSRVTGPGFQWGHPAGGGRRSKCHRLYLSRTGEREGEGSEPFGGGAQSEKYCKADDINWFGLSFSFLRADLRGKRIPF